MFDEQKIQALAELSVSTIKLIPDTWESVMTTEALPVDEWKRLAPTLRSLAEDEDVHNHEELQPIVRTWDLARLVVAERVEEVQSVEVPGAEATGYLAYIIALCRCVRARQLADLATAGEAVHLAELADTLQQGFRYYADDKTKAERAVTLIADTYGKSSELHLSSGDYNSAVQACAAFVAMSNVLSRQYAKPEQARRAISAANRFIEAVPSESSPAPMSIAALCNNAITSCKWLSSQTSNAEEQIPLVADGLKLAHRMQSSLLQLPADGDEPALPQVREACLRHLAELHASAALCGMETPDRHGAAAKAFLAELQKFAEGSTDQDLKLRVVQIARQVEDRLRFLPVGGAVEKAGTATRPSEVVAETIREALNKHLGVFEDAIPRIRAAPDRARSRSALEEALERWEEEIRGALRGVVAEVGLNHHVCRILLALGAVASGRLGTLADPAIQHWLLETADGHAAQTSYQASRQRVWAQNARDSELDALAGMKALAVLSSIVCQSADVQPILQETIRIVVRRVLRDVLGSAAPYVSRFDTPQTSQLADLSRMSNLLPPWCLEVFLSGYGVKQNVPLNDPSAQSRRVRVRRQSTATPGPKHDAAAVVQELLDKDPEKALRDIPRFDINFDDEQEAAESTGGDGTLVGRTFKIDSRMKRVEGILGEGRQKIVYDVVDLETGERTALAIFKETRSEKERLLSQLNELVKDFEKNENEILGISDRVLELDPDNESVLFNKGNILLNRHDESGALKCFGRAIEVAPEDLLNWLHAGVALSRLGRHEESLTCVHHAAGLDPNQSAQYLYQLPWMAEALSKSVRAVADNDSGHEDAQTLLRLFALVESARNDTST